MKLGNHTIGLRKHTPRVDGGGQPVRDDTGHQLQDVIDRKVRWCLVTPNRASTRDTDEPEERTAPLTIGTTLLAPPGTGIDAAEVVIWPITSEDIVDEHLQLDGPIWEVIGEVGVWDESEEARLRRSA